MFVQGLFSRKRVEPRCWIFRCLLYPYLGATMISLTLSFQRIVIWFDVLPEKGSAFPTSFDKKVAYVEDERRVSSSNIYYYFTTFSGLTKQVINNLSRTRSYLVG